MIEILKAKIENLEILEDLQKQLYGEWFDSGHSDLTQTILLGQVWLAIENKKSLAINYVSFSDRIKRIFRIQYFSPIYSLFQIPEKRVLAHF